MKIKIFGGIAIVAIAAAIAFNVSLNLNKSNNQLSQLALANVEALATTEGSTLYTRVTSDCVYTWTGKAKATFSVSIGGVSKSFTYDENGEATYTAKDAQVRCIGGGNEVCNAQNCPVSV